MSILLQAAPDDCNKRTTFDILWTCWATILICTWTSMHPNLPPRGQGRLQALRRRLSLMFWALIVPELVLAWAVKQWQAARVIESNFKKDYQWTRTHGHFLGMGGFTLINTIRFRPLRVPQVPGITVPVQPKLPDWVDDGQHWDRMESYWQNMTVFRKNRRRFCQDWERAQKNCSDYMYYNPEINNRELVERDIEDYKLYEMFGTTLPDALEYMYECPGTISYYRFRDLVERSMVSFPTITAAEIQDRSKGDILSKVIAIFQTTAFIIQLVARLVQRLPVTELELVTFALSTLNGLIYFFWWDKPLGVQEPVNLYLRGASPLDNRYEETSEQTSGLFGLLVDAIRSIPEKLYSIYPKLNNSISSFFNDHTEETGSPLQFLWFIFYRTLYMPISTVIFSLYSIIETNDIPPGATHVPTFYATNMTSSEMDIYVVYFILPIITVVFGGLHCLGWTFTFRTPFERILWRVSSLIITIIPFVCGVVVTLIRRKHLDKKAPWEMIQQGIAARCVVYFAYGLFPAYIIARLLLFLQALISLWRDPRDGIFVSVDWTKYFPRIT